MSPKIYQQQQAHSSEADDAHRQELLPGFKVGLNLAVDTGTNGPRKVCPGHVYRKLSGCDAFPAGGGIEFENVLLGTREGGIAAENAWTSEVRHGGCSQSTKVAPGGKSVSLLWKSSVDE